VVGLAGGIGSGKSTVARILTELGAAVIDSDQLSREEINAPDVLATLKQWWGDDIVKADGSVDRARIAQIVFHDPAQRHRLEALIHPRIAVRRKDRQAALQQQAGVRMIVLDSPLLYEADLDLQCDVVVFVDADLERRQARSEKARNWSPGELLRREKSQQPLDMKRARADYIVDNNSSLSDLRDQVQDIFDRIVSEAGVA